jgi:hypothetical protein
MDLRDNYSSDKPPCAHQGEKSSRPEGRESSTLLQVLLHELRAPPEERGKWESRQVGA